MRRDRDPNYSDDESESDDNDDEVAFEKVRYAFL